MTECSFGVFQPIRMPSHLLIVEAEVVDAFAHMLLGGENMSQSRPRFNRFDASPCIKTES